MTLEKIQRLADDQHGAVTRRQALKVATSQQLFRWTKQGRLTQMTPQVYVLPFTRKSWEQDIRVALWSLPGAALCGEAAARWWGIRAFSHESSVSLIAPWKQRSHETIVDTTCSRHPFDVKHLRGLPVTSIERTLADVAARVHRSKLKSAVSSAFHLRLTTIEKLYTELDNLPPRHRGFDPLYLDLCARTVTDEKLRSDFENFVLAVLRAKGLPEPEADYLLPHEGGKYFADFCWPKLKLVIEVNGSGHFHPDQVEYDRLRSNVFTTHGYDTLNFGPETSVPKFLKQIMHLLSQPQIKSDRLM